MVERVANEVDITKQATQAAVGAVFAEALARGDHVPVADWGRFSRKDRPAREGLYKPLSGEPILCWTRFSVSPMRWA